MHTIKGATIGSKIRYLMNFYSIKMSQAALDLKISTARLASYLNDNSEPSLQMLGKIALYFHVDLNFFANIKFPGVSSPLPCPDSEIYETTPQTNMLRFKPAAKNIYELVYFKNVRLVYRPLYKTPHEDIPAYFPVNQIFLEGIPDPEKNALMIKINSPLKKSISIREILFSVPAAKKSIW